MRILGMSQQLMQRDVRAQMHEESVDQGAFVLGQVSLGASVRGEHVRGRLSRHLFV